MERRARFVWGVDGLWPGPVDFNDPRLQGHHLHIEFRNQKVSGLPFSILREFIEEIGDVQIDAGATSHKEVMDLLMIGCQRTTIDIFSKDKEIALGHAVTEQVIVRIKLPSEVQLTYITDTLTPRLLEVKQFGPRSALLISQRKGDLSFVMDRLPASLRNSFSWWLAPDEGQMVSLRSDDDIAGWVLDGERMLGD
ncbi:MAG: hypothetical protein NZ774_04155 [Candidatus Poseidoniales archaeon]|nr:hypothetical protein [Candidatus Poseidoniales archaeon]